MKEFVQTIYSTSKERLNNPITGTFIISWIILNWRPIMFMAISDKKIEDKIVYIDLHFCGSSQLYWYSLCVVPIYVLIIPYTSLLFEYILEFARKERNLIAVSKQIQVIENKKEIAIEELKLEEAQIEFKERKNVHGLIEDLKRAIIVKDEELQIERERFSDLRDKTKEESVYLHSRFQEDRKEFKMKIQMLQKENEVLTRELNQLDKRQNQNNRSFLLGNMNKQTQLTK